MAQNALQKAKKFISRLGPGLITGASDNDPSGIATYSQAGAAFGTSVLWLKPLILPMMYTIQEMSGRIGIVTGKGIAQVLKDHYPKKIVYLTVTLLFTANTINIGANIGAMAAATQLLIPSISFSVLTIIFALIIVSLELFTKYNLYEKILKFLTLFLISYVLTGLIVIDNWPEFLLATITPHIQFSAHFFFITTAILGATITPFMLFWQASLETEEELQNHIRKIDGKPQITQNLLKGLRLDTFFGMLASQTTAWFITATAAAVLFRNGVHEIQTAHEAAAALEPLVASFPHANTLASALFAVGIIGLGFLAIPALTGSASFAVAEVFSWKKGLNQKVNKAKGFYGTIIVSTLIGLTIFISGINPIKALILAAIINGIMEIPLIIFVLKICNNKKIMDSHTNSKKSNAIAIFTILAISTSALLFLVFSIT